MKRLEDSVVVSPSNTWMKSWFNQQMLISIKILFRFWIHMYWSLLQYSEKVSGFSGKSTTISIAMSSLVSVFMMEIEIDGLLLNTYVYYIQAPSKSYSFFRYRERWGMERLWDGGRFLSRLKHQLCNNKNIYD